MKNRKYNPKKAKLITNGGFYKIVNIEQIDYKIKMPYTTRLTLNSSELYGYPICITHDLVFELFKVNKNMAVYRQTDCVLVGAK